MTKYALLIGINYTGTFSALRGCENDVVDVKKVILGWGFTEKNITFMTEKQKGGLYPNAYNITYQLNKLCSTLKLGDQAVFYYSGHGTRIKDTDGDEVSGYDSCIVPIDFRSVGVISDTTIKYYINKIPLGANLFCVFDSCNSGTVCDLKYNLFDTSYRKDITTKLKSFNYNDWVRTQMVTVDTKQMDTVADVISLTGCKDDQYSYELGRNGALTTALLKTIAVYSKGGKPTLQLQHVLQNVRGIIRTTRLPQAPQLMTGKPYDSNVLLKDFLKI
jgi:hypothetical protein